MLREDERAAAVPVPRTAPREARGPSPDVNPYARWVHEHPAVLLAEPSPAALRACLAAGEGPLAVDLGCGSGNFLLACALAQPDMRFVGFELRYKRLVKAARKVERAGLGNVWLLRERAERLPDYFEPGSLRAVTVNFPDPWPRRSDWKKRLVHRALLRELERLLEPGGRFHLKTDHSGYFLHVLSLVREAPGLRLVAFSNDHHRQAAGRDEARTEFEQLFRSQRKPVYSLVLERPGAAG
jgi:tRNA (guanine-N7-)-methyltransferase